MIWILKLSIHLAATNSLPVDGISVSFIDWEFCRHLLAAWFGVENSYVAVLVEWITSLWISHLNSICFLDFRVRSAEGCPRCQGPGQLVQQKVCVLGPLLLWLHPSVPSGGCRPGQGQGGHMLWQSSNALHRHGCPFTELLLKNPMLPPNSSQYNSDCSGSAPSMGLT